MSDNELDHAGRRLLSLLQTGFPLSREPYQELGVKLSISGEEVIERIRQLKANNIVRQISPVLDARKLGYQSTLVAMKVTGDHLRKAEKYIGRHPGISHGYERDHEFNIWVTLSLPAERDITAELHELSSHVGAEAVITLPAVRIFKLRTNFSIDEELQVETGAQAGAQPPQAADLSTKDRKIINGIQHDLPLTHDPFAPTAERLALSMDDLLQGSRSLLQRGIIRRYGASINHYNAGYKANAMTCWIVPARRVEDTGRKLASFRQVSHCYERKTAAQWPYNIFTMIHSSSRQGCFQVIEKISAETGLTDYAALFSTREFVKTRIKYHV